MSKKIKKYKVGLDSETMAISLVSEPAIEVDFIHMSKDKEEKQQVFLEKNDKYLVYGPVLVPEKDIYRNNGEQEYYLSFSKESIEKMENDYMKDFRQYNVSLQHQDKVDEVCVVESWLVADSYKDKANALGFNVPEGTWMVAMKVNNVDTWNRIKEGELRGFSVESLVSLEEFNKIDKNDNDMEVNNESFWKQLKEVISECFSSPKVEEKEDLAANSGLTVEEYDKEVEAIKEELEEEKPTEAPVEEPNVEEPKTEEKSVEEKPAEEPKEDVKEEPKEDNHLEEILANVKAEVDALKEINNQLKDKIKKLEAQPSTKPINTNNKPNPANTYTSWREQMRQYIV